MANVSGSQEDPVGASPKPSVWIGADRLILASQSASRRSLLESAGLAFDVDGARIDERALEQSFLSEGASPSGLAARLAVAKALDVSRRNPKGICLGADQTLSLGEVILHKPADLAAAAEQLRRLAGKTHTLASAICFARDGAVLFETVDHAELTMRALDERSIALYLAIAGPAVLSSVGAYQAEGVGVHLFERINGDHATILGLPLMRALSWLRSQGYLAI